MRSSIDSVSHVDQGGILRRGWDSNPRYRDNRYTRFPGEPLQPLGHLSVAIAPASDLEDLSLFPVEGFVNGFREIVCHFLELIVSFKPHILG